jgi:tetratricopeptide (TPR) repeat protein
MNNLVGNLSKKSLSIGIVVFVFLTLFQSLLAQKPKNATEEISEILSKAESEVKIWKSESIDHSFFLYKSAIDAQIRLNEYDDAIKNIQKVAWLEIRFGRFNSALEILKKAKKIEQSQESKSDIAQTQSLEALARLRKSDYIESLSILSKIQINETDNPTTRAIYYYLKAENDYNDRKFESAKSDYEKSIEYWQEANDPENEAYTLIDHGYNFMFISPPNGIEVTESAARKFTEIGNNRGLALSLTTIGVLNSYQDKEQIALDYFHRSEALFPNDVDYIEKARLFNGIGRIYEEFDNFALSLEYRQAAYIAFGNADFVQGQLATLHSLVKLSYSVGNTALANGYYQNIIDLSKTRNDSFFLGMAEQAVGDYFFDLKNYQIAAQHYKSWELLP